MRDAAEFSRFQKPVEFVQIVPVVGKVFGKLRGVVYPLPAADDLAVAGMREQVVGWRKRGVVLRGWKPKILEPLRVIRDKEWTAEGLSQCRQGGIVEVVAVVHGEAEAVDVHNGFVIGNSLKRLVEVAQMVH